MVTSTKIFTFDAAHLLTGHEGLCKNLHGHTYKVEVTVCSEDQSYISMDGMVLDFKVIKDRLNENLFDHLDHAFIYNSLGGEDEKAIAQLLMSLNMRVFDMANRPTAENMAEYFKAMGNSCLHDLRVQIAEVIVWETPTSYAKSKND